MGTTVHQNAPSETTTIKGETKDAKENFPKEEMLIYVLGAPGSGKTTQCSKIASQFGLSHLSVGDLLQQEIQSGSEYGTMIQQHKKEGKLVPSEMVVKVLEQAMKRSQTKKFLIDGFPRNKENLAAAENLMKIEPDMVLYFDCPEEESMRRILYRNQGRDDDNIETIKKRLEVYYECTIPVLDYYFSKGKVRKIDAGKTVEEVFEAVKNVILELSEGVKRTAN